RVAFASPLGDMSFDRSLAIACYQDNLYAWDRANFRVLLLSDSGPVRSLVGTGVEGYSLDGTLASQAQLGRPTRPYLPLAIGPDGSLYLNDSVRVRKIDSGGKLSTLSGVQNMIGIDGKGLLYFWMNNRIERRELDATLTFIAGNGTVGESGD